jgi:hypothetical protein
MVTFPGRQVGGGHSQEQVSGVSIGKLATCTPVWNPVLRVSQMFPSVVLVAAVNPLTPPMLTVCRSFPPTLVGLGITCASAFTPESNVTAMNNRF